MEGFTRSLAMMVNVSNGVGWTGPQARVVDRTSLTGMYEFELDFTGPSCRLRRPTPSRANRGPTVFYAIEKQLGLKLRKVKEVPVEVVVVDHAERAPTEN